jgi:hypothetical protein
MKTKLYVRVGRSPKGNTRGRVYVDAGKTVNHEALRNAQGALPTVAFAIEVDVPEYLFANAERVAAEVKVTSSKSIVEVEVQAP